MHGTPFVPRALVPIAASHTTVNPYTIIDPYMHVEERAHAYQINKTALASTPVNLRVWLDVLGQRLNLAATVDSVRDDWLCFVHNSWCDFSRLTILSFHNNAGDQINNTTTAANMAILLPVINDIIQNCRRPNIKFVRVQINLDFCSLVSRYSPDGSRGRDRIRGQGLPRVWNCFGCSEPHPYMEYKDVQHIGFCPNKDAPGVCEHATKNIKKMQKKRKRKQVQNQKRKNLGSPNFSDFDEAGQQRVREQCLAAMGGHEVTDYQLLC